MPRRVGRGEFQLPIWLYAVAGGLTVLLSVPIAVAAGNRPSWTSGRSWSPGRTAAVGRPHPPLGYRHLPGGRRGRRPVSQLVEQFYANPAAGIDHLGGRRVMSRCSATSGTPISPLNALGRALEQQLARDGITPAAVSPLLGMWPAVLQLLAMAWLELCSNGGSNPAYLAVVIVVYVIVHLLAMGVFGAEVWLERGELIR